jgi:hypothetical protein
MLSLKPPTLKFMTNPDKPVTTQTQQQLKMADKCVVNKQTRAASNIEQ